MGFTGERSSAGDVWNRDGNFPRAQVADGLLGFLGFQCAALLSLHAFSQNRNQAAFKKH